MNLYDAYGILANIPIEEFLPKEYSLYAKDIHYIKTLKNSISIRYYIRCKEDSHRITIIYSHNSKRIIYTSTNIDICKEIYHKIENYLKILGILN